MNGNLAHSIRQRLLNWSKNNNENFNTVLAHYVIQRLLYRLSLSDQADQFLLKGSWLFAVWNKQLHRPTRDADLLGFGSNRIADLEITFREIWNFPIEDGLIVDRASIVGDEIKKEGDYHGVRIKGEANLDSALIPFQIDIGFGDAVTPEPTLVELPGYLDLPAARLRAYPVYAVVAEKFHAMLALGLINSRIKDFYDIWIVATTMTLQGNKLQEALVATFARRKMSFETAYCEEIFIGLAQKVQKQQQWQAFIRKNNLTCQLTFAEVLQALRMFLLPVYTSCEKQTAFDKLWVEQEWR